MSRSIMLAACAMAMAMPAAGPSSAQDLAVTAAGKAKVVLDNQKVRVMELAIPPGGTTGMHSHGDNVVIYLTGGEATQTQADGTSTSRSAEAGEVIWSGPVTHETRNTGKAPVKVMVVELKDPAR